MVGTHEILMEANATLNRNKRGYIECIGIKSTTLKTFHNDSHSYRSYDRA
jgi:hypothetical protein